MRTPNATAMYLMDFMVICIINIFVLLVLYVMFSTPPLYARYAPESLHDFIPYRSSYESRFVKVHYR